MLISEPEILNFNPHWTAGFASSQFSFRRYPSLKISKWLDTQVMIGLRGLRRTGKSVMMSQLRDDFIREKSLRPEQYFHLSFDIEDAFDLLPPEALHEAIDWFFKQRWPGKAVAQIQDPILITIDEIQNVRAWQKPLKQFYDINPNIKFIVTGSASLFMRDAADSLAGRIMEFEITPMDFPEHMDFIGRPIEKCYDDMEGLFSILPKRVDPRILSEFERYLLIGGFPEAAQMSQGKLDIAEIQTYIRSSIIQKIISKDFRRYYQVKDTAPDYRLFELSCFETAQPVNQKRIAKACGMALETFKRHFNLFVESGLLKVLAAWDSKPRRRMTAHPKVFLCVPSLGYSFLSYDSLPPGSFVGHTVEGYVYQRLLSLASGKEIYYARSDSGKEVDFYLPKSKVAIESKYAQHYLDNEFDFLISSAKKLKLRSLVVSRDSWLIEPDIKAVPALFF